MSGAGILSLMDNLGRLLGGNSDMIMMGGNIITNVSG